MDFYLSPPKNICFMDGMRVYEDWYIDLDHYY